MSRAWLAAAAAVLVVASLYPPVALLSTGVASPLGDAQGQYVALRISSSPFGFEAGGGFRGAGYAFSSTGVSGWLLITSSRYWEGPPYIAFHSPSGLLAVSNGDAYAKQLAPPVLVGDGVAGAAYARYSSSTRLDVYALFATAEGSVWQCMVAAGPGYEEYPAVASGGGGILYVFFYNSSDRDYYAAAVGQDCSIQWASRVWDGGLYYTLASQVLGVSAQGYAVFFFRDWGNGLDVYAAVVNESGVVSVYTVSSEPGDESLGSQGAYSQLLGGVVVPVVLSNGSVAVAVASPGGVTDYRVVGGPASTPPGAVAYNGGVAVYYASNTSIHVHFLPSGETVMLAAGDVAAVAAAQYSDGILVAYTNSTGSYVLPAAPGSQPQPPVAIGGPSTRVLGVTSSSDSVTVVLAESVDGVEALRAIVIGAVPAQGRVLLYTLPAESRQLLDPGNPAGLMGLIGSAEESVHAALAFFDNASIAEALVDAAARGVDVGVVTDDDSLSYDAVQLLIASGVPVYTDAEFEEETGYEHTMHHKFLVVDGRHIIVSTANPTTSGLGENYEVVVVVTNATLLATALEAEYRDLAEGLYGTWDTRDVLAAEALVDAETGALYTLSVYAGPEHRIHWELESLVREAEERIAMAEYIFTTSYTIRYLRQAILEKAAEGVTVEAVFDWLLNEDTPGRFAYEMLEAGLQPVFSRGTAKMHAKTMVIDGRVLATGSFNPTGSAAKYNDESIVVVEGPAAEEAEEWIRGLYSMWKSWVWSVDYHPLVAGLGVGDAQYIVIANPTPNPLNLSWYLVGDAETVFPSDDEGLYRFPEGAVLEPGGTVIVAYNATAFTEVYGFKPDYEIVNTTPEVPDMTLYLPGRFGGNFTLDPGGDEAVLAMISPYDPEFIYIIDMLAYGASTALPGVEPAPAPTKAYPAIARTGSLDSVSHRPVAHLAAGPSASSRAAHVLLGSGEEETLVLGQKKLTIRAAGLLEAVAALAEPASKPYMENLLDAVDVYVWARGNPAYTALLEVKIPALVDIDTLRAWALLPNGTLLSLSYASRYVGLSTLVKVELSPAITNNTLILFTGRPVHVVGGEASAVVEREPHSPLVVAGALAAAAALVLAVLWGSRRRA